MAPANGLLCSDGLTDLLTDREIAAVMAFRAANLDEAALVKSALEVGGHDNVSVVVRACTRLPLRLELASNAASGQRSRVRP